MRLLVSGLCAAALLALAPVAASAQGKPQAAPPTAAPPPAPPSTFAAPTLQAVIDRWLPICVDNAGDPAAQRRAADAANLSLPWQVRVEERTTIGDTCTVVTTVQPGSTVGEAVRLLQAQLPSRGQLDIGYSGQYFGADFLYRGYSYRVIGMVEPAPRLPTPTFILVLSTGENADRRR